MPRKIAKPAQPRQAVTGSGWNSLAASDRIISPNLSDIQSAFVAARFGLDTTRARLTAELCWGCQ